MHTKPFQYLLVLTFCGCLLQACKSKSGHTETTVQATDKVNEQPKTESTTQETATPSAPVQTKANTPKTSAASTPPSSASDTLTRYWVSFYSIGSGVDMPSANSFFNWLDGEKAAGSIDFEKFRWGREGEVDACITLLQKSAEAKEAWISKAQERLSKAEHVHQKRNGTCKTRR